MGKQHTETNPDPLALPFELGAQVRIKRPALWHGCDGVVVAVYNDGRHRVKINGKHGATFHSDVWAAYLELRDAPAMTDEERELAELRGL